MAVLLGAVGRADAHVDILPTTIPAGTASELTVRVPNERDLATVEVRPEVPDGVLVYSIAAPPPGWRVRTIRRPDGIVGEIVWSRGRIGVGRYQDLAILATPRGPGPTLWPARQVYADGAVKLWTAPPEPAAAARIESGPNEPGPAAAVEVLAPSDGASARAAGDPESPPSVGR